MQRPRCPGHRPGLGRVAGRTVIDRLDCKIALISGAARGIGAETARPMVGAGARVVIGDILDERGRETAREIASAAVFHHLDVTGEADWNAAIGAAVARWSGLDILVNNAGLFLGKGIEEASLEERRRPCAVNPVLTPAMDKP